MCSRATRRSGTRRTAAVLNPEAEATVVMSAPGRMRRGLLVVPPDSTGKTAEPLMAAAAGGHV
jgi:hypothetical protein